MKRYSATLGRTIVRTIVCFINQCFIGKNQHLLGKCLHQGETKGIHLAHLYSTRCISGHNPKDVIEPRGESYTVHFSLLSSFVLADRYQKLAQHSIWNTAPVMQSGGGKFTGSIHLGWCCSFGTVSDKHPHGNGPIEWFMVIFPFICTSRGQCTYTAILVSSGLT